MRVVTFAALAGVATAQMASLSMLWSGRSTSMGEAANWAGASPFNANNLPSYTVFGNAGSRLISSIPSGGNIDVGMRIELNGDATIVLGSSGSSATLTLGNSGNRQNVAIFAPPGSATATASPVVNFNCNLNWRANGRIPAHSPCTHDFAMIPNDGNSYFLSTFGGLGAAHSITIQGTATQLTGCLQSDQASGYSSVLGTSIVQIANCPSNFYFSPRTGYTCPSSITVQPACVPLLPTTATNTNGILTATLGSLSGSNAGRTLIVVTAGPFAGQAFEAANDGTLSNVTNTMSITTVAAATTTSNGIYAIGDTTFNGQTGSTVSLTLSPTASPTIAPTQASAASSGGSGGASGSTAVIIIVIVIAVAVIIIVAVVVRNKKSGGAKSDHQAVSFENPMYDGADADITNTGDSGLYNEPGIVGDGYMDVPADGEGNTGYMETHPDFDGGALYDESETGGYMDVHGDGADDV